MDELKPEKAPQVNGGVLIGLLDCIKDRPRGDDLLKQVVESLPQISAGVCKSRIITVANYPYSVFVDCLKAVDSILGKGNLEECRQFGKYRSGMVVRFFLQDSSSSLRIKDILRFGDLIWKNNHVNSGYFKIEDDSPEHSVARIYDFPQMDPAHCRYMEGFLTQAMAELGAKWVEEMHEVECCSRGNPYHEFAGVWKYPFKAQ